MNHYKSGYYDNAFVQLYRLLMRACAGVFSLCDTTQPRLRGGRWLFDLKQPCALHIPSTTPVIHFRPPQSSPDDLKPPDVIVQLNKTKYRARRLEKKLVSASDLVRSKIVLPLMSYTTAQFDVLKCFMLKPCSWAAGAGPMAVFLFWNL